jgi:hypothetical protein
MRLVSVSWHSHVAWGRVVQVTVLVDHAISVIPMMPKVNWHFHSRPPVPLLSQMNMFSRAPVRLKIYFNIVITSAFGLQVSFLWISLSSFIGMRVSLRETRRPACSSFHSLQPVLECGFLPKRKMRRCLQGSLVGEERKKKNFFSSDLICATALPKTLSL